MYVPSLTSTTNGVFSYVYNQITGEDASVVSGYWNAFPNGMWVTALPTNNYEPLEVPRRDMTEKNTPEDELEENIAVLDQSLEQCNEEKENLVQTSSSLNRTGINFKVHDDLNTPAELNVFKGNEYFEADLSPFDDFLPNKKEEENCGGHRNINGREIDEMINCSQSADLFEHGRNKETPKADLQEVTGQKAESEIMLFKADDFFELQSSPFDDFPNRTKVLKFVEVEERPDRLEDVIYNSKEQEFNPPESVSADSFKDEKNELTSNQQFQEIPDQRAESEIKLFKANDYFEPQLSPFDDMLANVFYNSKDDKMKKSSDLFRNANQSSRDHQLKGSEIELFKAEDYFDLQPSVFDSLFSSVGSHRLVFASVPSL